MNADDVRLFGLALQALHDEGDAGAELILRREDGREGALPVAHFFRGPSDFTPIERAALDLCRGRVLDAGAGSGLHSLVLQRRGLDVTAIDLCPEAVEIMSRRGVEDARVAEVLRFEDAPFDTLLMLGHGVGMVETLAGLDRLLERAGELLGPEGRILLDSVDVSRSEEPADVAWRDACRRAGRYVGEIRMRFAFREEEGPLCGWLHVDGETLRERALDAGWSCEIVRAEESGEYLAQLASTPAR